VTAEGQLPLPFPDPRQSLETLFSFAHRELKPCTPVPEIRADYFPFAGINHTARLDEGRLTVRVSDVFEEAPDEVTRALALILLSKLYRKKIDPTIHRQYRSFVLRSEIQERARVARTDRGRGARVFHARGRHFDLEAIFDRINSEYFGGSLVKPRISWSAKKSRYILGRYDSTHHTIFISRIFDSRTTPSYVIDYVMYHEMLHVRHSTLVKNCRMIVHTADFKSEEQRFVRFAEAKEWLRHI